MDVLLIENQKGQVAAIKNALPRSEVTLVEAVSEGVCALQRLHFDLVILALHLPPQSQGIETYLRFVMAMHNTPLPPVVVYTERNDVDLVREALDKGAEAFVGQLQLNPAHMREVVDVAMTRHRVLQLFNMVIGQGNWTNKAAMPQAS